MEDRTLLTIPQAAREIGVKPDVLIKAITRARTLPAEKFGPIWVVERQALLEWNSNPRNRQRGPKPKSE